MLREAFYTTACLFALSGSASAATVVETGQGVIHFGEYHIVDKDLDKVTFAPGKSVLAPEQRKSLEAFVNQTKQQGQVDKYIVAAWSDQELPAKGALDRAGRNLAKARGDTTALALQDMGAKTVDQIMMTKQPNFMQRLFSTQTAELKGKGLEATEKERLNRDIGAHLRSSGGPGSVVVIAKFKHEVSAH